MRDHQQPEHGTEPEGREGELAPSSPTDTNPTDIRRAVALKYVAPDAPRVVAHGVGALAEKIIEAAGVHGVFIREDAILAEALGAVELDEEIPVELYTAVAEVIGFVLKLKGEAGRKAPAVRG